MLRSEQIVNTIDMIQRENLDVRTVTMGINLLDCRHQDIDVMCRRVVAKIERLAGSLVDVCEQVVTKYGVPIVNKRLAVSPAADVAAGHGPEAFVALAKAFGKGTGFGVLTFFFAPICLAILGFGSSEYNGAKKTGF